MNPRFRIFWQRFIAWLRRSFSFMWLVIVAAYLCVQAGQAVYKNYQSQQQVVDLQNRLAQAQIERDRLTALLVYYQTDSYKEKQLRQDLLLRKPGEAVFALPESAGAINEEQDSQTIVTAATTPTQNTDPIWRQWVNYLIFGDK